MSVFFLNILEITVGMSALVLLMLLILKLFGAKFTAKCRYVLWMLVLVRLAIPFSLNILPAMIEVPVVPAAVENVPDNTEIEDPAQSFTPDENLPSENLGTVITPGENSPTDPTVPTDPTIPTDPADPIIPIIPVTPTDPVTPPTADDPSISDPSKEEIVPPDPVTESPREPISAKTVLEIISVVYVAGAVAFFAWNMLSYLIYTRRILEAARPADARTVAVFRSICAKEKLSRTPTLLVSPEINSPAAFGIFRRKVVLPDIEFSDNGLAGTLFHEVIHCKRGDLFVKLVELVARSLHWFNPFVHIAAFRCEMEMEMSCDEKVLAGVSDDARLAYGRVMLDIIRRCRRSRGALTTHFNPKKSSVKSRFANIINGSGSRNGKVLIAICLVLCIIAGAIIACTVEVAHDIKEYKINVLVDEEVNDVEHNRNVRIIEVDVDSEHEAKINETISEFFLEKYNWYMEMEGGEVAYQLIDTTYDVRGNILGITGISRFTATSVPPCYVQTVFYDLENDKLCTLDEYFAAAGLDMARAKAQIEKYLVTDNYYDTTEYEILSVVYPDGKPVLVVKFTETSMAVEQPETVRLIGYDFDKYSVTWINQSFDGFDAIEWTDIPVHLTVSDLGEPTAGEYGFSVTLTSNVDVKNVQINELIADDFKITDCVPLYSVDLEAGKPITVEASKPGVLGKHGITYAEGSLIKRYEITLSGEDGSPILVPITSDRLADNFKGSDDPNYEIPPIDTSKCVNVLENPAGLEIKAVLLPVEKDGGYMDAIKFDEQHMLYITYEVAKNEETGKSYKTKPHLYLIDILNGEIKADYPYYLEDGEEFSLFDVDYTADGIIFMLMGNMGDRLGVMKAHRITVNGETLSLEPVERTELYPYNSDKIVSPTGEYVVYYRDEGGYGDGGIDVVYAGGVKHRILKNAPLSIEGGSLIAVSYYTPVGFADNSHLVYTIGGYEHIKGFGIYDLATGENLMFDDGKYQLSIVGDGVISFEEPRKNDEGLPEQYRTWSMTLDGKMTLTASVDEADGVMKMPDNITNRLRREPVYAFYTGSTREVPDYFYKTVSYRVETLYSADMKEKLAVIEYPSDSNKRSVRNIHFAENSVTFVLPVEPAAIPTDNGTNTTEDVFRSILENKEKFRWDGGEAYFTDLIDTRTVASAYTIINLDGKGEAELVVSLEHVISRAGAGTLIFHCEDDYVICHYLESGYFVGLMMDGSFQWSGDSGSGFAKLDFSGDSFTWVNITRRVVIDYPDINYYINDKPVTDVEYDKYQTNLLRGERPSWITLDYSREDSDKKAIESILSNKMPIRVVDRGENMLLSDYSEYSVYAIKKYTVFDLDKDGGFELVLWLGFENSPYSYAYLVLHRDGDIWYAHGFTARAFNCLKQNGQYTSSSSAFNTTLLEIDFEGDSYTETKVAQRIGTGTQESIEYYVGGERASKAEFEKIYDRYDIISQPTWYSLDPDTIDNIENWRDMFGIWYPEDGSNPAPRLYDLIDELVNAKSRIPEINELGITDYTIALMMESEYDAEVRLTFTVTGNSLPETLPPGTYTWTIYEGYDVDVTDYGDIPNPDAVPSYADCTRGMEKFGDYSAARAVNTFLQWNRYSDEFSPYGEWENGAEYTYPYDYICGYYGDNGYTIKFDDLAALMDEKFGITVTRPERDGAILSRCRYDAAYDTVTYADTRGSFHSLHKIIDVVVDGDVTYVTVQLYADRLYLVPSHKVRYTIGEGDVFLSSEIVEQGKYEPRELN